MPTTDWSVMFYNNDKAPPAIFQNGYRITQCEPLLSILTTAAEAGRTAVIQSLEDAFADMVLRKNQDVARFLGVDLPDLDAREPRGVKLREKPDGAE